MKNTIKRIAIRNQFLSLLIQHLAVLVIGIGIFLIDKYEQFSDLINYRILLVIVFIKSIYFLAHNFKSIRNIQGKERIYRSFITLMSIHILLIVLSFAIDYFILYQIYPESFTGILAANQQNAFVEFLYFSLVTFTTTGFGDIVPRMNEARILISMEIILAFISIIFIISNFGNLLDPAKEFEDQP